MSEPLRPPRLAESLAQILIADPALREAALGDLAEDFALAAQTRSPAAARAWYWSQVARSALSLSLLGMTRGVVPWLRLIASVVLGYVLLATLVMVTDFWLMARVGGNVAASWLMSVASLATGVSSAVVAGYVAALVGGPARLLSAAGLGLACVAISAVILSRGGDGSPVWYQVALMLVVLPSVVLGALLRAGRASRPRRHPREPLHSSTPEQPR